MLGKHGVRREFYFFEYCSDRSTDNKVERHMVVATSERWLLIRYPAHPRFHKIVHMAVKHIKRLNIGESHCYVFAALVTHLYIETQEQMNH
jgi:hypothetical protein